MTSLRPANIEINRPRRQVRITWNDGAASTLAFERLRAACPCAECKAYQSDDNPLRRAMLFSTGLESAQLVGNYAIQFQWEDGHRFGIYTWEFLRSLA